MIVLAKLSLALLCFGADVSDYQCYPMLYGNSTPIGEFDMNLRLTASKGYGGDVIQFLDTDHVVLAIHRLWLLNPEQHRDTRINSDNPRHHIITNGCINIMPLVYDKLKDCCINQKLVIE